MTPKRWSLLAVLLVSAALAFYTLNRAVSDNGPVAREALPPGSHFGELVSRKTQEPDELRGKGGQLRPPTDLVQSTGLGFASPETDDQHASDAALGTQNANRSSSAAEKQGEAKLKDEQRRASEATDKLADADTRVLKLQIQLTKTQARKDEWQHVAEQANAEAAEIEERAIDARNASSLSEVLQQRLESERDRSGALDRLLATAREQQARAESQKALEDNAKLARESASSELAAKLQEEQNKTAALAEDLVKAQAESQKALEDNARLARESASRELAAKLQNEQNKTAALAEELVKAQARIRQLQDRLMKPAAQIGAKQHTVAETAKGPGLKAGASAARDTSTPGNALTERRSATLTKAEPKRKITHGFGVIPRVVQQESHSAPNPATAEVAGSRKRAAQEQQTRSINRQDDASDEGYTSTDYSAYDTSEPLIDPPNAGRDRRSINGSDAKALFGPLQCRQRACW